MFRQALANYAAVEDLERRKERRRLIAPIVVGLALWDARLIGAGARHGFCSSESAPLKRHGHAILQGFGVRSGVGVG